MSEEPIPPVNRIFEMWWRKFSEPESRTISAEEFAKFAPAERIKVYRELAARKKPE